MLLDVVARLGGNWPTAGELMFPFHSCNSDKAAPSGTVLTY